MLGKGLESLIPQKGSGDDGNKNDDGLKRNGQPNDQPGAAEPSTKPMEPAQPARSPQADGPAASQQPVVAEQHATQQPSSHQPQPQPEQRPEPHPEPKPVVRPMLPAAEPEKEIGSVFHIEIEKIKPNPDQPRRNFDEAALRDLAHSIREFGFLQPLVVSRMEKETPDGIAVEYQLIAGERRLLAAKILGLAMVPAIIRNVHLEREKLELAVIENIQRENLNVIETARAFQRLQEEFRMTQREIASKLGKSREVVANTVRLLDLPEYAQKGVEEGKLSESNARLLLSVEDPGAQQRLFDDIVQNQLTTRDVRERIQALGISAGPRRGRPPKSTEPPLAPELKAMQESLSMDLGAPVEIHKGAANGRITITFYSEEELENILRRLGKED